MRELKFRAWNKERRFMSDPFGVMEQPLTSNGKFIGLQLAEDLAIMLFTGLSDKNGKEIYEGDVLRTPHFASGAVTYYLYHIVEWSEKYAGWFARSTAAKHDNDGSIQLWVYARNTGGGEVIGNIHEHSHLLKLEES